MHMIKTAAVLTVAAIVLTGLTTTEAHASTDRYLQRVSEELPVVLNTYGSTGMLNEGYKICNYETRGITGASDLADLIITDMPMSRTAAIELQVLAEHYLGC